MRKLTLFKCTLRWLTCSRISYYSAFSPGKKSHALQKKNVTRQTYKSSQKTKKKELDTSLWHHHRVASKEFVKLVCSKVKTKFKV